MPFTNAVSKHIAEQLNKMLLAKVGQGELLRHNLEKGLGNEEALRSLLCDFLPRQYGVAKGKIANKWGQMSDQLDIIIYDALRFAALFVDENKNQILPIESVYGVIEVKTTLDGTRMREAFRNLYSVAKLHERRNRSANPLVVKCPPYLQIFAFNDKRSLASVEKQFRKLSTEFQVEQSSFAYSAESPGHESHSDNAHLIASVDILNKGSVYHMLDGSVMAADYGEYTLAMFLTGLVNDFFEVHLEPIGLTGYLNWKMVETWKGRDVDEFAVFIPWPPKPDE